MLGDSNTDGADSSSDHFRRRDFLRTAGASAVGLGVLSGTASAFGSNPSISMGPGIATPDRSVGDDFPVQDRFVLRLSELDVSERLFDDEELGTLALPVKNSDGERGVSSEDTFWYEAVTDSEGNPRPGFVVGLHSPEVGDGRPDSLASLIGVRPVLPDRYFGLSVPVWAGPPPWQQKLWMKKGIESSAADFPSSGERVEVSATIWYGPDVFPPIVPRDSSNVIAQTPEDEINGPVSTDGGALISDAKSVLFFDPFGVGTPF